MRGRDDISGFVAGFAGDDRYIVDYLVEEVLQSQPAVVRAFLLQTSLLARMNASLCDAVAGRDDGRLMLEALDRANLFLVPLDDRRRWYRYHHLFAEVLQARLMDEQPDEVPTLHRRASAWYDEHGEPDSAIQHALAADDHALAATLIEAAIPAMGRARREVAVREWLEMLPVELFRYRPVLSLAFAGALLSTAEIEGVEPRLRDAERWVDGALNGTAGKDAALAGMVVVDEEEYRRLPASVAVYRAGLALARGDAGATVHYCTRALEFIDEEDHFRRAAAAALLGLARWASGDLEAAYDAYTGSSSGFQRAGYILDALASAITLADIRLAQGRLSEAKAIYEQYLQRADEQSKAVLRGTADMHVGISTVQRERGELDAAAASLQRSHELGEHAGLPKHRYRWRVAMAELRQARGDLDGALDLLDEAERVYVSDLAPNVRPVAALRARVWLAQGKIREALAWAREQSLSADDDLSYLREFEHVTLARILLTRHQLQPAEQSLPEAVRLLGRLAEAAESGGRTGTVIEISVVQAVAQQLGGDTTAALRFLDRALTLADSEGYVRVFVDEGAPMAVLLEAAARRGLAPHHVRRLRGAFG